MRSNAPAAPCWARRMASASVISLVSVRLVRVTVPVGTHPLCGMHPWLLELLYFEVLVPVKYRPNCFRPSKLIGPAESQRDAHDLIFSGKATSVYDLR